MAKRIEAVKQTPNATDEEKQAAVNQINQLKDQAFNQINQNQTNDQVDATTNQAINAIDNVEAEVVIKPKAIADIEKAVKEKQQQIDNSLDSTDNEKEVASQALAKEKKKHLQLLTKLKRIVRSIKRQQMVYQRLKLFNLKQKLNQQHVKNQSKSE